LVTFQKAACDIGWSIESLLVWDKQWIGPGGQKGLRPSFELVALFAGEDFVIPNRGIPDVQSFKWSSTKPNGHPAEKPVALMDFLIRNSTKPGDVVMDLFMGSGTTGVAALASDRRFIGVEMDERFFDLACERIKMGTHNQSLFDVDGDAS
jgi:DNA modification methylase